MHSPAELRRAARLHELANAVSLGRLVGSVALVALYLALGDGSWEPAFWLVAAIWFSDILDGQIARAARRRGGSRRDGQALDPIVDDFAIAAGFLVLLDAGILPLWFVALALMSRTLFALVRMVSLVQGRAFPAPKPITKLKGVAFGGGQLALFASTAFPASAFGGDAVPALVIAAMTAACLCAIVAFVVVAHSRPLLALVSSDGTPRVRGGRLQLRIVQPSARVHASPFDGERSAPARARDRGRRGRAELPRPSGEQHRAADQP